ncbi:MAG TPA: Gfo/Idh/MocA family oxidoreductase [Bacteroidota bacterium]|nr:Gfo/Idh/MocA family oxidoreductase [Bacteroidota bacterium]
MKNFALSGVAGYIAPRHLQAIRDTGNRLEAAVDPHDSVGILDRFFPDASFFTEFERFDRHVEKLRRGPEGRRIHFMSICTPNHLHDAHIRFALRTGAQAICEKPLVLKPWNLDALQEMENETGGKVSTVLQLRVHPAIQELKRSLSLTPPGRRREVCLTYVTGRGPWYHYSWKGDEERSGGLATNIGIHLFDLLLWLFGSAGYSIVHMAEASRMSGFLELQRANVRWFLSTDLDDLPPADATGGKSTYRSITIDGKELEFTEGFADLHTKVYQEILAGRGFGIEDARPSIQLVYDIRNARVSDEPDHLHPLTRRTYGRLRRYELLQA